MVELSLLLILQLLLFITQHTVNVKFISRDLLNRWVSKSLLKFIHMLVCIYIFSKTLKSKADSKVVNRVSCKKRSLHCRFFFPHEQNLTLKLKIPTFSNGWSCTFYCYIGLKSTLHHKTKRLNKLRTIFLLVAAWEGTQTDFNVCLESIVSRTFKRFFHFKRLLFVKIFSSGWVNSLTFGFNSALDA